MGTSSAPISQPLLRRLVDLGDSMIDQIQRFLQTSLLDLYLDVYQEDTEVNFDYSKMEAAYPDYRYSSNDGWMLGFTPTQLLTSDVDLLIDEDLLFYELTLNAAADTFQTLVGASQFFDMPDFPDFGSVDGGTSPVQTLGDLTGDEQITADDIDQLFASVAGEDVDTPADLNGDSVVDEADIVHMVHDLLGTNFGDANLDGVFDSSDLVLVFRGGEYEDPLSANSGWRAGDWNGDGEFDTSDLVLAFQDGGYVV